jgi:hypothetical protein
VYGEASHGWWCNSRAYPLRCRYCHEHVFYFTCDHGCRVLFDELGPPWPVHNCQEYWRATLGNEAYARGMAIMMMKPGVEIGRKIDPAYAEKVKAKTKPYLEPMPCEPYRAEDEIEAEGIVRDVAQRVNVFKQLDIPPDSAFGASLLSPLTGQEWGKITIHEGIRGDGESWSYTFLIGRKLLQKVSVIAGDLIRTRLRAFAIPGYRAIWICEELRAAF